MVVTGMPDHINLLQVPVCVHVTDGPRFPNTSGDTASLKHSSLYA